MGAPQIFPFPLARSRRKAEGYILLYVLWTIASLAVVLAIFGRPGGFGKAEAGRIEATVETRELFNVLDTVILYTRDFDTLLDRRFVAYQRVMQERAADLAKSDDRIALLKALLAQMNMKLDLEGPDKGETSAQTKGSVGPGAGEGNQKRAFTIDQHERKLDYGGRIYTIRLRPVNELPNLNLLERPRLERYLVHLGLGAQQAHALAGVVADWVDADDFVSDAGEEAAHYARLSIPYAPRNKPFQNWGDLAYLWQVTPATVRLLRQHFTLYGASAKVLPDALSPEAIAALSGQTVNLVKAYLDGLRQENESTLKQQASVLLSSEEEAIRQVLASAEDNRVARIEISGPRRRLTAYLDLERRRLLDWYLH